MEWSAKLNQLIVEAIAEAEPDGPIDFNMLVKLALRENQSKASMPWPKNRFDAKSASNFENGRWLSINR